MKTKNVLTVLFFILALISFSIETKAQRRKSTKSLATNNTFVKKSDDERRKQVESLMLQGKYQHDGSGELFYIGTIESVPALLKVLEDNPPTIEKIEDEDIPEVKKPGEVQTISNIPKVKREPRKFYICTYAHAINALKKITGQNFIEYQEWRNWWEEFLKNKEQTK